jgi:hypothetical protein
MIGMDQLLLLASLSLTPSGVSADIHSFGTRLQYRRHTHAHQAYNMTLLPPGAQNDGPENDLKNLTGQSRWLMTRTTAIFGLSLLSLVAASTLLGTGMPFRSIQISNSRLHEFCSSLSLISLSLPSATLVITSLITARSSLLHPKKSPSFVVIFAFFVLLLLRLNSAFAPSNL